MLKKWLTGRKLVVWLSSSGLIVLRGLKAGSDGDSAVTKGQMDTAISTAITASLEAANNTFTGTNTHSGVESFSNATGVTAATLTPLVAGQGTAIQQPVDQGEAFASPVTLTAAQSGRFCVSDAAAGTKWILPAATAANIGVFFEFYVATTVTSNSFDVEGATSADLFVAGSSVFQTKAATDGALYSPNGSSNYKLTSNGTTTGGVIGDRYKFICIGLNKWLVSGTQSASGSVATPFAG